MGIDEGYEKVVALPAWSAYAATPGPSTLGYLVAAVSADGVRGSFVYALATLFAATSNWRVAQHLANELMDEQIDTSLAEYYAAKAVELSSGDPVARLSLARCFWLQRFPEAVFSELAAIAPQFERYEPAARRAAFSSLHEVADLYVNAYCYANRIDLAQPWVDRLLSGERVRGDTLVQLFTSAFHHDEPDLALRVARVLVQRLDHLSGRDQKRVTAVIRLQFVRTLRKRR